MLRFASYFSPTQIKHLEFSIEIFSLFFSQKVTHTMMVVLIFDTCTKHVNTVHTQTKNKVAGRSPATC